MMISQIAANVPFFAIYLAALILALVRWDKHPTASVLVVTAAAIAVLSRVAGLADRSTKSGPPPQFR